MAPPRALIRSAVALSALGLALVRPAGAQLADIRVNTPDNGANIASFTQSETSLAVNGQTICVAWNDGGTDDPNFSGFGGSTDGGAAFSDVGTFPPPDPAFAGADPQLAYSARDSLYYFTSLGTGSLQLWRSPTCINTNTSPAVGTFTYRGKVHHVPTTGYFNDKEMLAIDNNPGSPYFGRAYVAFYDPLNILLPPAERKEIRVGWSDNPDDPNESGATGWAAARFQRLPSTGPGSCQ